MKYAKFGLAVLATVVSGIVVSLTGDNFISNVEWVNIAISGVGACAVFAAPNVPGAMYTKSVLSALTAALTLLTSFITDGVSTSEWLQIGVAVLGALGVYAVPNSTNEVRSAGLRSFLTLALACCLFFSVTGFKGCFEKGPNGEPSKIEEAAPYFDRAVRGLKTARNIFVANNISTSFVDKAIAIGEPLVAALESGADDGWEQIGAFIDAFEQITADVDLIKNATVRTVLYVSLAIIDDVLHDFADEFEKQLPRLSHALQGQQKKVVDTIKKFAKKSRLRCRTAGPVEKYKAGQFAPMSICEKYPDLTVVERVKK